MALSALNQRRWRNFRKNKRAYWSLIIFSILFGLSLFAEFIANDKPIIVNYRGAYYMPVFNFYPETEFGGDFKTEAVYRDIEVKCLITTGGLEDCFDEPEALIEDAQDGKIAGEKIEKGWLLWPPIPCPLPIPCPPMPWPPMPWAGAAPLSAGWERPPQPARSRANASRAGRASGEISARNRRALGRVSCSPSMP
jgi:microcin C transport system permease protein